MKVYRFDDFGSMDNLRLHDESSVEPGRQELLIKVHAVSLNHRDVAMVHGKYPQPCRPGLIPTSDAAGEVVAVGEGITDFKKGDRIMGCYHPRWFGGRMPTTLQADSYGSENDGWLCELKCVGREAVVSIPDDISYEQASTLPCAAVTAWTALTGFTPIRAGHTVLTEGTGGVSIFALQLAKACGARVIATTSSDDKVKRLKELGADEVVNYKEHRDWGKRVRELAGGRGVDRVVEVGGPPTFAQSLDAIAYGAEIASIGWLSSENPTIDFFKLKLSGAILRQIVVGDRESLQDVANVIATKEIQPVIDHVFEFKDAVEAFKYIDSASHFGKVVIKIAADS